MISGSFVPQIWIGFMCRPVVRGVYLALSALIFIIMVLLSLNLIDPQHRTVVMVVLVGSGIVPVTHFVATIPSAVSLDTWRVFAMFG